MFKWSGMENVHGVESSPLCSRKIHPSHRNWVPGASATLRASLRNCEKWVQGSCPECALWLCLCLGVEPCRVLDTPERECKRVLVMNRFSGEDEIYVRRIINGTRAEVPPASKTLRKRLQFVLPVGYLALPLRMNSTGAPGGWGRSMSPACMSADPKEIQAKWQ